MMMTVKNRTLAERFFWATLVMTTALVLQKLQG